MNKKWTKAEIAFQIETNNAWLVRALLAIYNRQTEDEKSSELTKHENGVGFNGVDSPYLSRIAQFYLQRGFLTKPQIEAVRQKMKKYAGQLADIANGIKQ